MSVRISKAFASHDLYFIIFGIMLPKNHHHERIGSDCVVYVTPNGELAMSRPEMMTYYNRYLDGQQRDGYDLGTFEVHLTAAEFLGAVTEGFTILKPDVDPTVWESNNGRVLTFCALQWGDYAIKAHIYESSFDRDLVISNRCAY